MDPVTQAALGAVVGELVLGRQLGRRAIGWGALFGIAPDLDFIFPLLLDAATGLRLEHSVAHSLLAMGLAAVLLARPLARRWKKEKITPQRAGGFILLVLVLHDLLDALGGRGVSPFDPFNGMRLACDCLPDFDPVPAIPLLVAVIIGFCVKPKAWKKGGGRRPAWWCLGIVATYLGLAFWAKDAALRGFEADLARRGIAWHRRMETPMPFNLLLRRGLVERNGEIWLGYRSLFDGVQPVRWTVLPKGEAALARHADARAVKTVQWYARGWWIARDSSDGLWMADLRAAENRQWDRRGVALRPVRTWNFIPAEGGGGRLRRQHRDDQGSAEMFQRMGRRLTGDRESWQGAPRLVAPILSIQEYLDETP